MAQKTRPTLKTYFEAGDKPTQGQYAHLIDSSLNLAETGVQAVTGSLIVSQSILVESHITASGNISASGTIYANDFKSSGGDGAGVNFHDNLNITGSLTASGNISASGTIIAEHFHSSDDFSVNDGGKYFLSGDADDTYITTGGNNNTIQFVANNEVRMYLSQPGGFIVDGGATGTGNISASGQLNVGNIGSTNGHITASGNISASGNITGETGSFDNGIILTAPNGNKFRFIVNNSGHLSITGSAV